MTYMHLTSQWRALIVRWIDDLLAEMTLVLGPGAVHQTDLKEKRAQSLSGL